ISAALTVHCCSALLLPLLSVATTSPLSSSFFFLTAPATTEIYTLSLHDALPIYIAMVFQNYALYPQLSVFDNMTFGLKLRRADRSEEHTSELQSRSDLVCRLLLEKKKKRCSTLRPRAPSTIPYCRRTTHPR